MREEGLDVKACVERVLRGDEDAARALMTHLYPLVVKLVRAHLPRRTSEEDLVQTVFMKVFSRLEQFSGAAPLEHWVSRITVNTCYGQLQHERVRPELRWADLSEEEESVVRALGSTDEELPASEQVAARDLVNRLLSHLSAGDRLVVTMLHLEGRSVAEISQATGWSATLVKVRAFRARRHLRKHLEMLMKESKP
jgi:RNA polymerase sigma-70 factor (ECF subfamily)